MLHNRSPRDSVTISHVNALKRWQDAHATLVLILADYLNACACLERALSYLTIQSDLSKLAHVLSCVDNSLPSLDLGAAQLQNAQKTLRHLRNRSPTLAPINYLPTEILSRIFTLAHSCVLHASASYKNPTRFTVGSITSVCSYWRKIAIETSSLWCHIDFSVGRYQDADLVFYAREALGRTRDLPLHIHVAGGTETATNYPRLIQLLAPYANRIVSLDIQLDIYAAETLVYNIFGPAHGGSLRELSICDEDSDDLEIASELGYILPRANLVEYNLLSLTTLHLRGPLFDPSNPAFEMLTELVLKPCVDLQWTYYELNSVLSSCPKLRSLTLISPHLRAGGQYTQVVDLKELEVLDLRGNEFKHIIPILTWINAGTNALSLSLSIVNDQPMHELFQLRDFIERSHVTRFCLHMDYGRVLDLGTLFEFLKDSLSLIEELAFQENTFTHHIEGPRSLGAEHFPRLHTLHFVECSLASNALQQLLSSSSVRKVQFMSTDTEKLAEAQLLWKNSEITTSVSFVRCMPLAEGRPLIEWPLDAYP